MEDNNGDRGYYLETRASWHSAHLLWISGICLAIAPGRDSLVIELSREDEDTFTIDEKAVLVPHDDVGQVTYLL